MSLGRPAWLVWAVCVALTLIGHLFLVLNGGTRHSRQAAT